MGAAEWRNIVSYDPATGDFVWLVSPSIGVRAGDPAGALNGIGRRVIRFKGRAYYAHRLAWLLTYGEWPVRWIDHVNGVPSDNRIVNLREANSSQNNMNKVGWNRLGIKGVWRSSKSSFAASISLNGKSVYLGSFPTAEGAATAYAEAAKNLHGEFARSA